jgi:hypothetical protein
VLNRWETGTERAYFTAQLHPAFVSQFFWMAEKWRAGQNEDTNGYTIEIAR